MNWKIGQKLVYIDNSGSFKAPFAVPEPKLNEVVTYLGKSTHHTDCIIIEGYETCMGLPVLFKKWRFRPLIGESAKSELVSSFKEVTETSDCPMIPETETV